MLIHYSLASFELLERKLSPEEKEELFDVFYRMGMRMGLKDLPPDYNAWSIMRNEHLHQDLAKSDYTIDLYKQYRKHLGPVRFMILKESQKLVVPAHVGELLGLGKTRWITPLLTIYKLSRKIKMDELLKAIILPSAYKKQIKELDIEPA